MGIITCTTDKALKKAIAEGAKVIKITNSTLAKRLYIVLNIPPGGFAAAIGCAGLAITMVKIGVVYLPADIPTTGGTGSAVLFGGAAVAATPVVVIVGLPGAVALIGLGAALGGATSLRKVYSKYRIKERGEGYLVIEKK